MQLLRETVLDEGRLEALNDLASRYPSRLSSPLLPPGGRWRSIIVGTGEDRDGDGRYLETGRDIVLGDEGRENVSGGKGSPEQRSWGISWGIGSLVPWAWMQAGIAGYPSSNPATPPSNSPPRHSTNRNAGHPQIAQEPQIVTASGSDAFAKRIKRKRDNSYQFLNGDEGT